MERPVDVLDLHEGLRRPFYIALTLHATGFGAVLISAWIASRPRDPFGDPNSLGGGAYAVTPVSQIPMPLRSGPKQLVANDTESQVPAAAKPEPRKQPKAVAPDAIPLPSKRTPKSRPQPSAYAPNKAQDLAPNQITSSSGAAASSPIFSQAPGSGGVGVGPGAPFGQRFGGYSQLVRDNVARAWRTDEVDPRMQSAPVVIVSFEILRNGQARDLRIQQSSGNLALDNSTKRAILTASPFPPLPPAYERDSATVEIWFQLKR
jgi:periplasmic protein TonB